MGSLIVVLIAVAVCCSETRCDTLPTATIVKPKDAGFLMEANASNVIDKGFFVRNPSLRKPTKLEELKNLDSTRSEADKRKARLLGGLAFLAGLSFGGLATAASNVKTFAKMPQASLTLNVGPSKSSPYFAAYYSPYSFVPYPFYPLGFLPPADPSKLSQVSSHNDVTPQVISVFDNRQPGDFAENEYANQEKKNPDDDKSVADGEDGAEHRPELRAEADRNAEEKMVIRGCKETQRKHGHSFKGSPKDREDLQVDADSVAALKATNMTADTNQTVIRTTNTTDKSYGVTRPTKHPMKNNHSAEHPHFPGYFEGYPQDISHVDLTTGSDAYRYQNHGQINYNLPYERPATFYRDDVYSNHHVNPYFPGSFSPDQIDGYVGADFGRVYPSEYQPSYVNGFKPVK